MYEDKSHKSLGEDLNMEGTIQNMLDSLLFENKLHVVGVGGCGCNTVSYITAQDMTNVKTIGINTDDSVLGDLDVDRQMFIGRELTDGNGADGDPDIGQRAAERNEEQILKTIEDADIVILVAGLGGGTGSGASKVIADLARRNGKLVVMYAVLPFSSEKERYTQAKNHLEELSNLSNTIVVFENDKILVARGKETLARGFELASEMLYDVVKRLKMEYIAEFFHEIGFDEQNLSKNFSVLEEDLEEPDKVSQEPPVIEALKYVENGQEAYDLSLDSFLDNYH